MGSLVLSSMALSHLAGSSQPVFQGPSLLFKALPESAASMYLFFINTVWISGYILFFTALAMILFTGFKYLDTIKFRMLRSFYLTPLSPVYVFIFDSLYSLAYFLGGWIPLTYMNIHNFRKREILFIALILAVSVLPFFAMVTFPSYFNAIGEEAPMALLKTYDTWHDTGELEDLPFDDTAKHYALTYYLRAEYFKNRPSGRRYENIAESLSLAIDKGLDHYSVMNNYGNALLMTGKAEQAMKYYAAALEKRSTDAAVLFNISQYYLYKDDYTTAKEYYDRAFENRGGLTIPVLDWNNLVLLDISLPEKQAFGSFMLNTGSIEFKSRIFSISRIVIIPALIIFIFISLITLSPFTSYWASFVKCDSCGDPIIAGGASTARKGRILCASCNFMIPRGHTKPGAESIPLKIKRFKSILMNLLLPGSGYILRDKLFSGFLIVLFTTASVILSLYGEHFLYVAPETAACLRQSILYYPVISIISTAILLFTPSRRNK